MDSAISPSPPGRELNSFAGGPRRPGPAAGDFEGTPARPVPAGGQVNPANRDSAPREVITSPENVVLYEAS